MKKALQKHISSHKWEHKRESLDHSRYWFKEDQQGVCPEGGGKEHFRGSHLNKN